MGIASVLRRVGPSSTPLEAPIRGVPLDLEWTRSALL